MFLPYGNFFNLLTRLFSLNWATLANVVNPVALRESIQVLCYYETVRITAFYRIGLVVKFLFLIIFIG